MVGAKALFLNSDRSEIQQVCVFELALSTPYRAPKQVRQCIVSLASLLVLNFSLHYVPGDSRVRAPRSLRSTKQPQLSRERGRSSND